MPGEVFSKVAGAEVPLSEGTLASQTFLEKTELGMLLLDRDFLRKPCHISKNKPWGTPAPSLDLRR